MTLVGFPVRHRHTHTLAEQISMRMVSSLLVFIQCFRAVYYTIYMFYEMDSIGSNRTCLEANPVSRWQCHLDDEQRTLIFPAAVYVMKRHTMSTIVWIYFSFFSLFHCVLVPLVVFLCFDLLCMAWHDTKDERRFTASLPMRHTSLLAVPNSRAIRHRVHNFSFAFIWKSKIDDRKW